MLNFPTLISLISRIFYSFGVFTERQNENPRCLQQEYLCKSVRSVGALQKNIRKQSLRAVLRTLIKIYTFAPNFKFGTK